MIKEKQLSMDYLRFYFCGNKLIRSRQQSLITKHLFAFLFAIILSSQASHAQNCDPVCFYDLNYRCDGVDVTFWLQLPSNEITLTYYAIVEYDRTLLVNGVDGNFTNGNLIQSNILHDSDDSNHDVPVSVDKAKFYDGMQVFVAMTYKRNGTTYKDKSHAITVSVPPTDIVEIVPSHTSYKCVGNNFHLRAQGGDASSYQWLFNGDPYLPKGTLTIYPQQSGLYTLQGLNNCGELKIINYNLELAAFDLRVGAPKPFDGTVVDGTICIDGNPMSKARLSASPYLDAADYTWKVNEVLIPSDNKFIDIDIEALKVGINTVEITVAPNPELCYIQASVTRQSTFIGHPSCLNRTMTKLYDENEDVIVESGQYFDLAGNLLQSQSKQMTSGQVMISAPLYDKYQRASGQTLPATASGIKEIDFKTDFIKDASGNEFDAQDLESNAAVSGGQSILGKYYGASSLESARIAKTSYAYTKTEFWEDGSGEAKASTLPGEAFKTSNGHLSEQKTMEAYGIEIPQYALIRSKLLSSSTVLTLNNLVKQVVIDQEGQAFISVTDQEGNAIASFMDGIETDEYHKVVDYSFIYEYPGMTPKSVDVFLSQDEGGQRDFTFLQVNGPGAKETITVDPGFQTISREPTGFHSIEYKGYYRNYAYNFYNDRGLLIASIAPNGMQDIFDGTVSLAGFSNFEEAKSVLTFTTFYEYDFQGRLLKVTEPDAGVTEYMYRRDGQIRFSQNAEQKKENRFSYTNYDHIGRPIQSGEYKPTDTDYYFDTDVPNELQGLLENKLGYARLADGSDRRTGLPASGEYTDVINTYYDTKDPDLNLTGYEPDPIYLRGAVAYTKNENVTTHYNYDEFGRVSWIVQEYTANNNGLDKTFTIDYAYDYLGNVTQVDFQKTVPEERFSHRYGYDADQRLIKAETSIGDPTDSNNPGWYTQAEYEYFLHGPLKRVVLADGLQGIDYTYTAQGWLKAINNPAGSDPGSDGSVAHTGTKKDVFGMALDYYSGDFSGAYNFGSPTAITDQQFDGNIQASRWMRQSKDLDAPDFLDHIDLYTYSRTSVEARQSITLHPGFEVEAGEVFETTIDPTLVDPTVSYKGSYAYAYDTKNQLASATYSDDDMPVGANNVDKLQYDLNGNIKGLVRNDNEGNPLHDFDPGDASKAYKYEAETNQLTSVADYADYTYNDIGQLEEIIYHKPSGEDETWKITYDVSGKVTKIEQGTRLVIEYKYDDRGFRILKKVGDHETWFVRDASGNIMAIYTRANATATSQLAEWPIYGSSKIGTAFSWPDHWKYNYEITDHLGNVRSVISSIGEMATATMELGPNSETRAWEVSKFDNIEETVHADGNRNITEGGVYVARLDGISGLGGRVVGPAKSLEVVPGEKVELSVTGTYEDPTMTGAGIANNSSVAGALGSGFYQRYPESDDNQGSYQTYNIFLEALGNEALFTPDVDKDVQAYLQYVLFDENFVVLDQSDYVQIDNGAYTRELASEMSLTVEIPAGAKYMYAYVVNRTEGVNVFFDHFQVTHCKTDIIQATDYYPFGMVMNNFEKPDDKDYRYGYQGQYAEEDKESGWNHFQLREYDPVIGRWLVPDPYRQYASPYKAMGNNPAAVTDPDGGCDDGDGPCIAAAKAAGFNSQGDIEAYKNIEGLGISERKFSGTPPGWMTKKLFNVSLVTQADVTYKAGFNLVDDKGTNGFAIDFGSLEILQAVIDPQKYDGEEFGSIFSIGSPNNFTQGFKIESEYGDVKLKLNYDPMTRTLKTVDFGVGAAFVEIKITVDHVGVHHVRIGSQEDIGKSINGHAMSASYFTGLRFDRID